MTTGRRSGSLRCAGCDFSAFVRFVAGASRRLPAESPIPPGSRRPSEAVGTAHCRGRGPVRARHRRAWFVRVISREVSGPSFNDPTARPRAYWHEHLINCTPFADYDWLYNKVERASIESVHSFCCPQDLCMPSTEYLYGIRQGIQLRRDPVILATVSRDFMRFLLGNARAVSLTMDTCLSK